ncbi:MAG: hypothetical protein UY72_C0005G0012 [Candidatus Uhrbacteria bacterium GW2011_GWD2_52_7]|uniref:DHHA1 domain-containing protein n=1 Tax=Candidatus Uhrbacteria bacterium GW2011_GWD2_52_7 TaxID=1618989 RepID=A0A0G1XIC5_9BACT|nr:MAG: hypothetical protein UY72_C0005G0012 [Candidatus Uhrbacteria bacterium GW2011_GWD2_52_7]
MITKIAQAAHVAVLVSSQPHGAKLENETNLNERLRDYADIRTLVIVEIPGPAIEEELMASGYTVVIIDHHRYDHLDRMQPKSSLEQFLSYFEISHDDLVRMGFDPTLVYGIGYIDRGFLWEMEKEGVSQADQRRIRAYQRQLALEIGDGWEEEEAEAKRAWSAHEERDGYFIVRSDREDVSIRAALSFLLADLYGKPSPTIIVQGDRRVYVQDADEAKALFTHFGGFTFGQDKCWGYSSDDRRPLPTVDAILEVVRHARHG